jgi:hypothetical protein
MVITKWQHLENIISDKDLHISELNETIKKMQPANDLIEGLAKKIMEIAK